MQQTFIVVFLVTIISLMIYGCKLAKEKQQPEYIYKVEKTDTRDIGYSKDPHIGSGGCKKIYSHDLTIEIGSVCGNLRIKKLTKEQ